MFEYIDQEVVKATLLFIAMFYLLLASRSSKRKPIAKYYHVVALLVLSVLFIDAYIRESKSSENIKRFSQGAKLECQIDSTLYRVSKGDDWVLDKAYFIRESLMIRADKCEEF